MPPSYSHLLYWSPYHIWFAPLFTTGRRRRLRTHVQTRLTRPQYLIVDKRRCEGTFLWTSIYFKSTNVYVKKRTTENELYKQDT